MATQGTTGIESIRHLLERFPEDEATVRDLIKRDPTFAALCEEYRQTGGSFSSSGNGTSRSRKSC